MVTVEQLKTEQIPAVRKMLQEYLAYAATLHGSEGAPTFANVDEELAELPGVFAPPKGRFLVAQIEGLEIGCVALKPIDETTCELKRLYVKPSARGQKAGMALVEKLVWEAREIGYKKIILDSHMKMTAAHLVYRMNGFKDTVARADFPEALKPFVVFMERDLTPV
jgi:GNAT superfamily N-acetyltransferase